MGEENLSGKPYSRRKFLAAAGSGVGAVLTASGAVRARNDREEFRRVIEQSHRVREKTGSQQRWYEFLRNRGLTGTTTHYTYQLPAKASSDGVSTQEIQSETELNIWLTLWYNCETDEYYAEQNWTYDDSADGCSYCSDGAPPVDVTGFGWDYQWWDLASYSISEATTTSSNGYVSVDEDSFDGTGPAFRVNDEDIWWDGNEGNTFYGGCYIVPVGDATEDERRIQGSYTHTWNSIEITGISVSFPAGVSVSVSDTTYTWRTTTENDQDTLLRVKQSGASNYNCGSSPYQ